MALGLPNITIIFKGLAASAIAMESADTINPAMSLTAVAERIQ